MGIMKKLSQIFSGGAGSGGGGRGDNGMYYYVRLNNKGEIVQIRLDPQHDLAPDYKNGTYFSRKAVIGPKTIERADATFYFDEKRSFTHADISGGELSDAESYHAQQGAGEAGS